ncbi:hypothetical protein ACRALDRAFT_211482 [Sodiomyces alcalophilus JCM 7366]|uniref:uncharacterized protein n=1 Tax=Sodiomyces alcalophilus JCM 7366 TaxID=591952 RepID=UPI0039B4C973
MRPLALPWFWPHRRAEFHHEVPSQLSLGDGPSNTIGILASPSSFPLLAYYGPWVVSDCMTDRLVSAFPRTASICQILITLLFRYTRVDQYVGNSSVLDTNFCPCLPLSGGWLPFGLWTAVIGVAFDATSCAPPVLRAQCTVILCCLAFSGSPHLPWFPVILLRGKTFPNHVRLAQGGHSVSTRGQDQYYPTTWSINSMLTGAKHEQIHNSTFAIQGGTNVSSSLATSFPHNQS